MWRDTRMIMLVAVVAAVYAAVLIPFKLFTIIPGITSIRPANVFPVIFGIMFGPAAAWGAAIGNLIGDLVGGTFGPGSVGGFVGNFAFGFVGYKMWGNLGPLSSGDEPDMRSDVARQIVEYAVIAVAASAACAVIIAGWVDFLGLVPFTVLGPLILTNNTIAAVVLGPPLLYLVYPRIKDMGLLYTDVMRDEDISEASLSRATIAAYVMLVVPLAWLGLGVFVGAAPGATSLAVISAVGFVLLAGASVAGGERLSAIEASRA